MKKEIATYNFEDVTPITMKDIIKVANQKMPVEAMIKVSSVKINFSTIEGVSNSSMLAH